MNHTVRSEFELFPLLSDHYVLIDRRAVALVKKKMEKTEKFDGW